VELRGLGGGVQRGGIEGEGWLSVVAGCLFEGCGLEAVVFVEDAVEEYVGVWVCL
jgi:hypothetical protein